jgi:hypothetical protein
VLEDPFVRKAELSGEDRFCGVDLVRALTDSDQAQSLWDQIRRAEPFARLGLVEAQFDGQWVAMLNLVEVMRLIQVVDSPKARRLSGWLASVGARHVAEEADPELAVQRLRQSYASAGRPRAWIDQRLRSVSARLELVREWNKRGIHDGEEYRRLTNALTEAAFGVNVNTFRRRRGARENLRDHLTDMELALVSLAETVAASLHRTRNSNGIDQLLHDVQDAGVIASQTRTQIDQATWPQDRSAPRHEAVA